MAVFNFQKPDKVIMIDSTDFEGKFEFRPLEPGYGLTVGNALRRVLLSSLEGFAITSVRIEGVDHEFSTIAGVVEDVTEMILNLKQMRFKRQIEDVDNESVSISISGQEQITAGDFQKFISGFQVLNSDLVVCNLDPKVNINMAITIGKVHNFIDRNGSWCSYVTNDAFRTLYCHCSSFLAEEGSWVAYGDSVCVMGDTGFSTGAHTHISIYEKGSSGSWFRIDPTPFLFP